MRPRLSKRRRPRSIDGLGSRPDRLLRNGVVDQLARLGAAARLLQGGLEAARQRALELEALDIPGVEAAQVARCALLPEVLDRTLADPVELCKDLALLGRGAAAPEQLLEDPRVAERAARDHHRGDAGSLEGLARRLRGVQAAAEDDRGVQRPREL